MIICRARHCAAIANPPHFPSKNETPASSNADASGKLIAAVHQVTCTAITSSDDAGDSDHLVTHPGLTCILDSPTSPLPEGPHNTGATPGNIGTAATTSNKKKMRLPRGFRIDGHAQQGTEGHGPQAHKQQCLCLTMPSDSEPQTLAHQSCSSLALQARVCKGIGSPGLKQSLRLSM
jgi:hypothetical protein